MQHKLIWHRSLSIHSYLYCFICLCADPSESNGHQKSVCSVHNPKLLSWSAIVFLFLGSFSFLPAYLLHFLSVHFFCIQFPKEDQRTLAKDFILINDFGS